MTLLNTINAGGQNFKIASAVIKGSCATPAGSEVKVCSFSDSFELEDGDMLLVKFTYANTYGDGSTTYPKLQVNNTNYVIKRADGSYISSGEWQDGATIMLVFDGTDFILPAGSTTGSSGVPLGTIIAVKTNQVPDGYLPCNGVAFDTNQYPALYQLLGDDHTPEEGFEMDWANAESVTLSTTDYVVTKSGWLVGYYVPRNGSNTEIKVNGIAIARADFVTSSNAYLNSGDFQIAVRKGDVVKTAETPNNQNVHLVPYKYYKCIKATSGLDETQQDYVLRALNEAGSYSTEEVATGKKWIDGKPIYRKVLDFGTISANASKTVPHNISNLDKCIKLYGFANFNTSAFMPIPYINTANSSYDVQITGTENGEVYIRTTSYALTNAYAVLEYTKTTPST